MGGSFRFGVLAVARLGVVRVGSHGHNRREENRIEKIEEKKIE